jgi:hypothetical protein
MHIRVERMVSGSVQWPSWWLWELDTSSPHLAKRMRDRQFNEVDLREMLQAADTYYADHEPGRWAVQSRWRGADWEIIIEPLFEVHRLLVITAYRIEPRV